MYKQVGEGPWNRSELSKFRLDFFLNKIILRH